MSEEIHHDEHLIHQYADDGCPNHDDHKGETEMEKRGVIDENTPLPIKSQVKGQRIKMGEPIKSAPPIADYEDHISKRLADKVKDTCTNTTE